MEYQDGIPPAWAKEYLYVSTRSRTNNRWLGCFDPVGKYHEVCWCKSWLWFKIKVFVFKMSHPKWKFK